MLFVLKWKSYSNLSYICLKSCSSTVSSSLFVSGQNFKFVHFSQIIEHSRIEAEIKWKFCIWIWNKKEFFQFYQSYSVISHLVSNFLLPDYFHFLIYILITVCVFQTNSFFHHWREELKDMYRTHIKHFYSKTFLYNFYLEA